MNLFYIQIEILDTMLEYMAKSEDVNHILFLYLTLRVGSHMRNQIKNIKGANLFKGK